MLSRTRSQGLRDVIAKEIRFHAPKCEFANADFYHMLQFVHLNSDLLSPKTYSGPHAHQRLTQMVIALVRISLRSKNWVRSISGWYTNTNSIDDQFHSLVSHLFAKYPVPKFVSKTWFTGGDDLRVFLQMADGIGPRQCSLPLGLTKSMAREFMMAPDDLTIVEAVRWAQIRGMGGSARLARTILATRLKEQQDEESFWIEVLAFFCRAEQLGEPALDLAEVEGMIEFIQDHRYEAASKVLGYLCENHQLPLQPQFTVRKRTLRWLRRHMANWQSDPRLQPIRIGVSPIHRAGCWKPLGIMGLVVERNDETWVIEELLTSHELQVEGGIMKHCVGGYDRRCMHGFSSIWSMRVTRGAVKKRVMTIEVNPYSLRIVHVSAKSNAWPCKENLQFLRKWARRRNLGLAKSLEN